MKHLTETQEKLLRSMVTARYDWQHESLWDRIKDRLFSRVGD